MSTNNTEARQLFDRAYELGKSERWDESLEFYRRAVALDSEYLEAWHNIGFTLGKMGRHQESIAAYDRVIELNPRDPDPWSGKAYRLHNTQRLVEAIGCFLTAQALGKTDMAEMIAQCRSDLGITGGGSSHQDASQLFDRGVAHGEANEFTEALACYQRALEYDPNYEQALNNKGWVLGRLGRPEEAVACCEQVLKINPRYEFAQQNLGSQLSQLGRKEETRKAYDRLLELNPFNAAILYVKGQMLCDDQRFREGYEYFRAAQRFGDADAEERSEWSLQQWRKQDEDSPASKESTEWRDKGSELMGQGRWREALKCFDEAIELNPHSPEAWYQSGYALGCLLLGKTLLGIDGSYQLRRMLDDLELLHEAKGCFEKAKLLGHPIAAGLIAWSQLQITSADPNALNREPQDWFAQGVALFDKGQMPEALSSLRRAIRCNPQNARAWIKLGHVQSALGKTEAALKCFEHLAEVDCYIDCSWTYRGYALAQAGRYDAALAAFDSGISFGQCDEQTLLGKGRALIRLDRHQEALQCIERVLNFMPGSEVARQLQISVLKNLGREDEALTNYNQILLQDPRNAEAWYHKAQALREFGNNEEAISAFNRYLRLKPRDAEGWNEKGLALSNLGRYEEACACYDQAIELNSRQDRAWYNKGLALSKSGEHHEALSCFEQAERLGSADAAKAIALCRQM